MIFRLCLLRVFLIVGISSRGNAFSFEDEHHFSQLTFDSDEERNETNLESSFWGRIYIDSFPDRKGFQYFRAHYGIAPPIEVTNFVLADPIHLCYAATSVNEEGSPNTDYTNKTLVVRRGECEFYQKSQTAAAYGAQGILIVNNEHGNMHPSAPGKKYIPTSTSMISQNDGERLIAALRQNSKLSGKYIPMSCQGGGSSYCEPMRVTDSMFVDEINYEGVLTINSTNERFPYNIAEFGGYLSAENKSWTVYQATGDNYCSRPEPIDGGQKLSMIRDVAVLVPRGGCSFTEKARNAAESGATLMLLVNDSETIIAMGGGSYEGSDIHIPSVMIPKSAGNAIEIMATENTEAVVSLSLSP